MNLKEAKHYLARKASAELLVIPRRHSYILQVKDKGKLENIRKPFSMEALTCETMEQVNTYAKRLNKMDYSLVQNCPHVEMGGFDKEGDVVRQREDRTVVNLR